MEKTAIAVGTTSEYKLAFLKEVLGEIGIYADVELFPVNVPSKISSQPLTEKETKKGSINRAKAALKNCKQADFGLGIEAGYNKNKEGKFEIFCYATIFNKKGMKISCVSHKFQLPKFHHEKVESSEDLCKYVKIYYEDATDPVKKYLGEMIDSRKLIIQDAIRQVLLRYILSDEF